MSFYNLLKDVFGLSEKRNNGERNMQDENDPPLNKPEVKNWFKDEDIQNDDTRLQEPSIFHFWSSTEPSEVHTFFESQLDRILRSFHMFDIPSIFGQFENFNQQLEENFSSEIPYEGNLRDQYLKPGYQFGNDNSSGLLDESEPLVDKDLDGKIEVGEMEKFCKKKNEWGMAPFFGLFSPSLFGNMTTRNSSSNHSFTQINGKFETKRSIKDSEGNERVTITRKMGDQSYSFTTTTSSNGVQSTEENFVNMSKEELPEFEKKWYGN